MNVLIEIYLAKPLAVTLATTFKFAAASDSYDDSKLHFIEEMYPVELKLCLICEMLVHVHIFSTAKPFVTKLGMVINHYEAVSCKRLVCCLQGHVALKVYVIKCNCFCYVF